VTKADPLDDASNVIKEVDGMPIVDPPQHLQGITDRSVICPWRISKFREQVRCWALTKIETFARSCQPLRAN
jgi:hypothetical protein